MSRFRFGCFFAFVLFLYCEGSAVPWTKVDHFTPNRSEEFAEKWRWRNLDQLNSYALAGGAESVDGKLYFAGDRSLVTYDGYKCVEFPYPPEFEQSVSLQVFTSKNGLVYLLNSRALLSFEEGEWTVLKEFDKQGLTRMLVRIVRNSYGLELVALPDGLYRIKGFELVLVPQVREDIFEMAFDYQNRLWIVGSLGEQMKMFSYQFDRTELSDPLERKEYGVAIDSRAIPRLIGSNTSDETWIVNWRQDQPPYRYDNESDSWVSVDFTNITGNNHHNSGMTTQHGDLILFSKTELITKYGDDWRVLKYPDFDIPTNEPFVVQRLNGNLILGGRGEKIYEIDLSSDRFETYRDLHFQCDDEKGVEWFLSAEGEIVERDSISVSWKKHTEGVIDTPVVMLTAHDGTVWAAGAHQGQAAVCRYDGDTWTLDKHPNLGSFVSHLSAIELTDGRIVFGSGEEELVPHPGGAVVYQKNEEGYEYSHFGPPVFAQRPVSFAEMGNGDLLMAGLRLCSTKNTFDSESTSVESFHSRYWVDHIVSDNKDTAWVGLWDAGLFQYKDGEWRHFTAPLSIASNQVVFLLKDQLRENSLWVATSRGISRYDGERWYSNTMPSQLRLYREGGTLKQSKNGSIWINTASRNWYFRENIDAARSNTLYEDFQTVRYTLDTDAPEISVIFADKTTTSPANVRVEWKGTDKWSSTATALLRYSYRYDDTPWTPFERETSTVLLDVPAGDHTFEVRAIDRDGNISTAAAVADFSVLQPIWKRTWFLCLVGLTLLIIVGLVYLLVRQRIRHIIRMDEFKLQFFTNISHELRTPLTVIVGPLESLLARPVGEWTRRPLEMAHKNAKKTLKLIDQLLDFRKAETGNVKLNFTHSDIVHCLNETIDLIRPLAVEQSQLLEYECNVENCKAWFDSEKLERILNNLISNASKYTQEFGKIVVKVNLTEFTEAVNLELIVEDNGGGIPQAKIDSIFEVFYRAGNASSPKIRGSGLGLAYTKKLVETFAGSITVESPITNVNGKEQGTRFIVHLPLQKVTPLEEHIETEIVPSSIDLGEVDTATSLVDDKPSILVIEDDPDIREFLAEELKREYSVSKANNGELGLKIARAELPDLILTDVMMPKLGGRELCLRIKSDPLTCHIPVIMLTALKSEQHEMEGLDAGADDYLSKPISVPILEKRIRNQLEARRKLHEHIKSLGKEEKTSPKHIATNPLDEGLLTRAFEIVENELEDVQFDVTVLAQKLGMSRMTLHRKFKAVTGESPGAFVRSLRMKKAAELLQSGTCSVTEVTYSVGFSDPSGFAASFKKHFKCSPSKYVSKYGKEEVD